NGEGGRLLHRWGRLDLIQVDYLKVQEGGASSDRLSAGRFVRWTTLRQTLLRVLFRLRLSDDEAAVFAVVRAQQRKAVKSRCIIDRMPAGGKSRLELWALAFGNLNGVDLDNRHGHTP